MSQADAIRSDLTLLLRRQALSDYALACRDMQAAAERCAAVTSATADMLVELRRCRARVMIAEETLDLLGDDVVSPEAWDLPVDSRGRDLVMQRVRLALGRVTSDLESSEQEILAAADEIKQLHALLDKLGAAPAEPSLDTSAAPADANARVFLPGRAGE